MSRDDPQYSALEPAPFPQHAFHEAPLEALSALDAVRQEREDAGIAGAVELKIDSAPGREPKWRVIADGRIVAAYDVRLIGRPA